MAMTPGAALITGGARRLGRAMVQDLAKAGWAVAIHCNGSVQDAGDLAAAITDAGGRAVVLPADLMDDAQTDALVARAAAALDAPLSLLINNASIFEHDHMGAMTRRSWDRAVETNLHAPMVLTQAFAEQAPRAELDARGLPRARACVVNMVDQRVLKPTPEFMSYSVAKAGLWAFTRMAAHRPRPHLAGSAPVPSPFRRPARGNDSGTRCRSRRHLRGPAIHPVGRRINRANAGAGRGAASGLAHGRYFGCGVIAKHTHMAKIVHRGKVSMWRIPLLETAVFHLTRPEP
jgi:NAD(P)-dependent dehydrogenase (short-subunit alcohol dehydrogenase family)